MREREMKKNILLTIGLITLTMICFQAMGLAVEIESLPPEWITAGSFSVSEGTHSGGELEDTYTYNLEYLEIRCDGGTDPPFEAEVDFNFGGVKCSRVKIYVATDPPYCAGNPCSAYVKYSDEGWTYLGVFNPYSWKEFNLNTAKYTNQIRIRFYRNAGIGYHYLKVDYIRCYTTGQP